MKTFNNLQVGDKVFKIFFKLRPISGLNNIFSISKITKIEVDQNDETLYNFWTDKMQFDLQDYNLDDHCVVYGHSVMEIYSTSVFLGIFHFVFRLIPTYILFLLDKLQ